MKIKATVPEGARTAAALGTEREGHGILIDGRGHILTTGYLVIESETIEVTGPGGRKVKAAFVGYDHATGFGLVRAESPLGVEPIELGRSADIAEGAPVLVAGYGGLESAAGARVVARREFAGYWEYLLENAIYTAPPYAKFAGAALIGPDGRLLGVGSLFTPLTIPGVGTLPCNVFIPIDLLQPILQDLITTRPPERSRPAVAGDQRRGDPRPGLRQPGHRGRSGRGGRPGDGRPHPEGQRRAGLRPDRFLPQGVGRGQRRRGS